MNRATRASALAATTVLATTGALLTCTSAAGAATATVTCKSPVFKRQFYANTTFSGTPKKTDCDSKIDQNWGTGAPAAGLPSNYFGVRWTVTRDFGSGGPFSIPVATRDGLRVYLDGTRKVDIWKNVSTTQTKTVNITIPAGKHTLRFDFVNWTGYANVKADYLPRTSATVDTVKPLVPTGTTLTYDSSHQAKFGWTANKEMDLAGYRVYRRLAGTSYGSKPLATTTSTSYTDTTLPKNGAVYYYEVRAYDKAGNVSAGTADKSVTTVDVTAPAAPQGVEDAWKPDYSEKASLSWYGNTEADLAGYHVYRSTSLPVALTAANRRNGDTPRTSSWYEEPLPLTGDTYYYVVTAVDTHGNESAASAIAELYTRDETGPVDTAYGATAVEDERGVTLTWEKSAATSEDFVGYTVIRYDKPRGESGRTPVQVAKGIQGTSFTESAPPPGATYYYTVVAVDDAGNGGTPSVEMPVAVAGNSTPPPPVTGLTATAKENGVSLSWDASDDPGFDHYRVLRGTLVDGEWVYKPFIDGWTLKPQEVTETRYLDRTVADGEHVRYSVVAVDQYGNQIAPDTGAPVADVTELDLRPDADAGPAVGDNPLGHLNADQTGYIHWWLGSDTGANGSKVTSFTVYRWNRSTHVFDKVDVQTRGDSTSWSYVDTTMPKGTTTYYRVTATLADGTETAARETAIASVD
ncbi:hypothetical protein StrepF001_18855 [Streptomyces sp. F001]|uniref:PA14 domain-containing protein n=1 Tax=Streptomyces sp. F001 TaxID=1510026 RepID=UPI00101E7DF7|nr:PA14 domain-containing protein [Streptomyces sp. F001]RZB17862.1 hypothetical protein StrepF001_18855 [Streptomyces sp. F001]